MKINEFGLGRQSLPLIIVTAKQMHFLTISKTSPIGFHHTTYVISYLKVNLKHSQIDTILPYPSIEMNNYLITSLYLWSA